LGSGSVFPWYGIYSLNLVRVLRKKFCILNYGQISACGQSVLGNKVNLWLKSLSGDLTGSRRLQERHDLTIAPGRSSMKTGQVLLLDTFPSVIMQVILPCQLFSDPNIEGTKHKHLYPFNRLYLIADSGQFKFLSKIRVNLY